MSQSKRVLLAAVVLLLLAGTVLGIDALRRRSSSTPATQAQATPAPGSIPIYVGGQLAGSFTPTDLDRLKQVSFVDAAEGKTQDGWLLRDVLLLYVQEDTLQPATRITVSSNGRGKSAQVTWAEVKEPANMVMFDLSNRGTLKLVSLLETLDTREEWVQDVDEIEIATP